LTYVLEQYNYQPVR